MVSPISFTFILAMDQAPGFFERFFSGSGFDSRNRWFKRLLYVFLIYKCLHWNYFFEFLFSQDSYLFTNYRSIGQFKDLAFLLLKFPVSSLSRAFVVGVFCISVYRLFFDTRRIWLSVLTDLMLWFLVLNLHNKMYAGLSGGNLLLNQLLLFNGFISKTPIQSGTQRNDLILLIQRLAILAIQMQLMLLYFLSAFCKLAYAEWLQGTAISTTLQIEHYSLFVTSQDGLITGLILVLLNYLILFYQLFFPVLVWFKKIARQFLLIGIGMHLFIGIFMGLPDFAMIMLLGYIYFWPMRVSTA